MLNLGGVDWCWHVTSLAGARRASHLETQRTFVALRARGHEVLAVDGRQNSHVLAEKFRLPF